MSEREIGGKYRLEEEIARGGMGTIWMAVDLVLRRRVALKLMAPEHLTRASSRDRFEQEALAIAQLTNPNVVQVYDCGLDGSSPYIVMELLDGEDLEARLRRRGCLALSQVSAIVTQAATALAAVHGLGIVHRDLKPSNIFLVPDDGDDVVKILDFGVASLLFDSNVRKHTIDALVGTPQYMSPEQARGKPVDARSDIWSLAVVAYRALTGRFPFYGGTLGDILVDVCTATPPAPSSLNPHLDTSVDRFFDRAFAKNPEHRFQSVIQMAAALASIVRAAQSSKILKVLVIDDEPDAGLLIRQHFHHQIRQGAYDFICVPDGPRALDELQRHPEIDLVVTDISTPGMDGLSFLKQAKELNPFVKVVILSAYGDVQSVRAAMNLGATDFLVKPLNLGDLEIAFERAMHQGSYGQNGSSELGESRSVRGKSAYDNSLGAEVPGTIAFIEVYGFEKARQSLDASSAVRLLNANFEIVATEISVRGGFIDKFMGPCVMAVFLGQDHAERAVEACIACRGELDFMADRAGKTSPYVQGICTGIATGMVIAAGLGSKAIGGRSYTVLGPPIATAASLSKLAQKNQILVDPQLVEAIRGKFQCEDAGQLLAPDQTCGSISSIADRTPPSHRQPAPPIFSPTVVKPEDD